MKPAATKPVPAPDKTLAEQLTVEMIKPAPFNELIRDITPEADAGLAASMRAFGDLSGIVFNMRSKNLVSGHQRFRLLKAQFNDLKLTVTAMPNSGKADGSAVLVSALSPEKWNVRLVDKDDEWERMANLSANNSALTGTFRPDAAAMVGELTDLRPDMANDLLFDRIARQVAAEIEDAVRESGAPGDETGGPPGMELQPFENYDYVLVVATSVQDWNWLVDRLGIQKVNASPIAGKKKIGLGRAINAQKLIQLLAKTEK